MEETAQQNKTVTLGRSFITFVRENPLLVFAFCLGGLFLVIVIITLMSSSQNGQPQRQFISPTTYPLKNRDQSKTVTPAIPLNTDPDENVEQPEDDFEKTWEYSPFKEDMINDFEHSKSFGPNGTVIYSFPSKNPRRPNIMVTKGQVTIVNRTLQFDTNINDTMDYLGKPDYLAIGSLFWGKNAAMYIYFERGLAFTADMTSKKIFEQMEFMPVPPEEFKKAYGEDIIGDLKKY